MKYIEYMCNTLSDTKITNNKSIMCECVHVRCLERGMNGGAAEGRIVEG